MAGGGVLARSHLRVDARGRLLTPRAQLKARLDLLIWVLIFAGMFAFVLGIASRPVAPATGWALMVTGGCVTAAGVVLIWVRSRLDPDS